MPMISSDGSLKVAIGMIRKMKPGYEIEFKTFKKDRGFLVMKKENGDMTLREFGFSTIDAKIEEGDLDRLMKTAFAREFPRSHEVRYAMRKIRQVH